MIGVYADTSVFGGVFDPEFSEASRAFFQLVREGRFQLVISSLVEEEIEPAPENVRHFFADMAAIADFVETSDLRIELQMAYFAAEIVTPNQEADALHVALASVAGCFAIVSWNFKHIVHFQKMPLYRAVNLVNGYNEINIYSPLEIVNYEKS